jgi:group I intron endonuclease
MESSTPHIYLTTNLVNGKIYIGQHNGKILSYKGSGVALKRAFKKYGRDNFTCKILQICANQETTDKAEEFWIQWYDSTNPKVGYNISTTANTYSMHGADNHMYGRKHTDEAIRKMSESRKGRKMSDQQKIEQSKRYRGKGNPRYVDTSSITEDTLVDVFSNNKDWISYCNKKYGGGRKVILRLLKSWGYNGKKDFCEHYGIKKIITQETRMKISANSSNHPHKVDRNSITDEEILRFLTTSKRWVKDCKSFFGFTFVTLKNITESKYKTRRMKEVKFILEKKLKIA